MYPYFGAVQPTQNPWNPYQTQRQIAPQQIVQVSGPESLSNIQMAPNSSMLAMHQHEAIVYLCQSDGVGKISFTAYDITPHKDESVVLRESIDARIAALEAAVTRLEEKKNESYIASNDVKQTDASYRAGQANDEHGTNGWKSGSSSANNCN